MEKTATKTLEDLGGIIITHEGVDLMAIDPAKVLCASSPCDIINPLTKAKTGGRVWLYSMESERVQSFLNERADQELRKSADLAARGKDPEPPSVERSIKRQIELLTVATDRWEGINMNGATNVDFSVQRAIELYRVKFIREQLQNYANEHENFMQG